MTCFHCRVNNCKVCDGTCGLCGQLCPGYVAQVPDRSSENVDKNCDGCDDCKCDETEKGKEL